ncbi:MAG TPA: hypothetical protein P5119_07205 [Candidatus Aminicenantes bacterium]|nr:hypothetical protein [Candidatus Aminicenantes bacterium]HRY65116.1 hypothetical protein [Candidatus Aminicenantes bacterium]HRZ72416.1 hypothetical protein [Candidatus Aminicenantes bacterium]
MRQALRTVREVAAGLLMLPMVTIMSLMAQTAAAPARTFSTTIYLDYRHFLSDAGPATLKPAAATSAYLNNQFVFRRAYFTYENKINDNLKFRLRLDADNTANVTGVTLTGTPVNGVTLGKDDKLRPFIKHLYLEYANFLIPKMVLNVGLIETLTFKPAEDRWGLRSVAKTLVDGFKDITKKDISASSADIGATLKYSFAKHFRVAAGIYNGAGYGHAENDQYKRLQVQAQITPVAGFSLVGYCDYERKLPLASLPGEGKPRAVTCKADAYFEMVRNLVIGGEWFAYKNDLYQTAGDKYRVGGWSAFGRYALKGDRLQMFARYDSYAPNSLDRDQDVSLIIAGLDWAPYHPSWRVQPNVWLYHYRNGLRYNASATGNDDLVFNLTFFLSF